MGQMSHDYYSYRPSTNAEDAKGRLPKEVETTFRDDREAREIKEQIAAALVGFNPRLQRFNVDLFSRRGYVEGHSGGSAGALEPYRA